MEPAQKNFRANHPERHRSPAALTRLVGILLTVWVLSITPLPAIATVAEYEPVSTSIPIPTGYTEMLIPNYHGLLLQTYNYGPRTYPSGSHNMQFMAFRNPATSQILYVQTQDPDGQTIDWQVYHTGSAYALKLTIYRTDATFPSGFYITDMTMTAATQTEFLRKVAKKYKSWAINQKWAKRKASPMENMETMMTAPDLSDLTLNNTIAPFIDAWNGAPSACWITFWRKNSWEHIDDGLPDYRLGGIPGGSLDTMATLSNVKNCAPFAYTNALLWDSRVVHTPGTTDPLKIKMNEVWTNNPDARYDPGPMIKNPLGEIKSHAGPAGDNMKYICQASGTWKTTFTNAVRAIAADGWKGIYYDMAALNPPIPCYDETHGHALADPTIWQNGIRDILATLKTDPLTKHMMIFSEGNAEIYMDLIDAFLTYEETAKIDAESPVNKQVPLFREVYGEFARFISWQMVKPGTSTIPTQTVADLTPAIVGSKIKQASNFGSQFNGSPYFMGRGVGITLQKEMVTNPDYADLFDLVNNPHYKKIYERGGGDINWLVQGTVPAPAPVNVMDGETGTAAVSFGMTSRDNGAYYELDINEPAMSHLTWDMKMTGNYYILVQVAASDGYWYNLLYDQQARNFRQTVGTTLKVGLGTDSADGQWRSFNRDLQDDLYQATGKNLTRVRKFRVFGQGLVDNIVLSNAPLVYENGTATTNWLVEGSGLTIASAIDGDTNSAAIQFSGIANRDDGDYFIRMFDNEKQRFDIAWDMKTSMPYYVDILVFADDSSWHLLRYEPEARDFRQTTTSGLIRIGIGTDTDDGQWRTFRRNLADDLYEGTGKNIAQVYFMQVYASGSMDNLLLWGNGLRSSGR